MSELIFSGCCNHLLSVNKLIWHVQGFIYKNCQAGGQKLRFGRTSLVLFLHLTQCLQVGGGGGGGKGG